MEFNEPYHRMFIHEILEKELLPETSFKINIVGYIVSADCWNNKKTFFIDDSTGLLLCILWINENEPDIEIQLGQKVSLFGSVSLYKNFKQTKVHKMGECSSLQECYFILNKINESKK
jgi:hypothetical protein